MEDNLVIRNELFGGNLDSLLDSALIDFYIRSIFGPVIAILSGLFSSYFDRVPQIYNVNSSLCSYK